jgi:hypothetical protein
MPKVTQRSYWRMMTTQRGAELRHGDEGASRSHISYHLENSASEAGRLCNPRYLTGEGRGGLFKTNPGNVSHTLPQK